MSNTHQSIEGIILPEELYYCKEHTWAKAEGDFIRIGITDYAQSQLGDIIFIELPEPGSAFVKGQEFGCAESAKSVSPLYMPVSGQIEEVNPELSDSPEIVNRDAYNAGWMLLIKPKDLDELKELLTKDGYIGSLK